MPLLLRKTIEKDGTIAVWKISEDAQGLLLILKQHGIYADLPFSRNPQRQLEWLTARVLLAELEVKQKIIYSDLGKPFLEGKDKHISISHSGEYVGVIVHPELHAGIDIEKTGDRIHKVSHKFVNDNERSWLSAHSETEQLYIIWGAKECAFKIFGLGEIDFRDNLEVEPFSFSNEGFTKVHFKKGETHCVYQVFFQYLDNIMITYAIAS
jgi:4'-phosphopantetheinyl transferase